MYDYFVTFLILLQTMMTMFQDYRGRIGRAVAYPALNDTIDMLDKITDIFYMLEAILKAENCSNLDCRHGFRHRPRDLF